MIFKLNLNFSYREHTRLDKEILISIIKDSEFNKYIMAMSNVDLTGKFGPNKDIISILFDLNITNTYNRSNLLGKD